ncbi:MAG: recombinase family protein [Acidimicrobiia bacterium]
MRVVGYVRDAAGPAESEPAFSQAERIRRWVHDTGHQLVAICQDVRTPGHSLGRDGYKALLGIVGAEDAEAEAVIVPDLTVLSPDKVTQEVMLWDLRSRGVAVLSVDEDDQTALTNPPSEQIRMIVRDVLAKVALHTELLGTGRPTRVFSMDPDGDEADSDVIIELIPPDHDQTRSERLSPSP